MKTPKGYYTISEASTRLDLSNAMVRRYVDKGRIRYMVPQGRSYGFYSKKDVDELANELNAYLSIEDEERKKLTFKTATKADMREIIRIGRLIFDPTSTRQMEVPEWQLK